MLSELSVETVDAIRLQQISRMLLAQQGQLVDNLLEEGVMTYQNAEEVHKIITLVIFPLPFQRVYC